MLSGRDRMRPRAVIDCVFVFTLLCLSSATAQLYQQQPQQHQMQQPMAQTQQQQQMFQQQHQQMQQQMFQPQQQQMQQRIAQQQPMGSAQTHQPSDIFPVKLVSHPACVADVRRICGGTDGIPITAATSNVDVMRCILDSDALEDKGLSIECHHVMWQYRHNVTRSRQVVTAVQTSCAQPLLAPCATYVNTPGHFVLCAIEQFDQASESSSTGCEDLLEALSIIVFTDYRLVDQFASACDADIGRLQCGRLASENDETPHQQGATIDCLSKQLANVLPQCRQQLLRVAELQADDYHRDRTLFFACRDDRETLCSRVHSGEGRVYKCLRENMFSERMSDKCRIELRRREQMVSADFRVSRQLTSQCQADIERARCVDANLPRTLHLAYVVICLEDFSKRGNAVDGSCMKQLNSHRHTMMRDYTLSPELVVGCHQEIDDRCSVEQGSPVPGGQVLQCLLRAASASVTNQQDQPPISGGCQNELNTLMRMANVAKNWRVDPVLEWACAPVVQSACSSADTAVTATRDGEIFNCLMQTIGSPEMNEQCENSLIQLQYFIMRDFTLDQQLFSACYKEASTQCGTPIESLKLSQSAQRPHDPLILPCLYRLAYSDYHSQKSDSSHQISRECRANVRRVMHNRGNVVGLHPRVEKACMSQMGRLCNQFTHLHGRDMQCLIDQYSQLTGECADEVKQVIADRERFVELDPVVSQVCKRVIKENCMDSENSDDVMECLIALKTDSSGGRMNGKCRAAVTHFQVVTLPDYEFSHKFKQMCGDDVRRLCVGVKTRSEVTSCLSSAILEDKLKDTERRVSKQCERQVELHVLEREDSVQLDPQLMQSCDGDISRFCSSLPKEASDGQVLECLRTNQKRLSRGCHRVVFQRQQESFGLDKSDLVLIRSCKTMILKFCDTNADTAADIVDCLKAVRDEPGFDARCDSVLEQRMIEQKQDFRLHPRVVDACRSELNSHCSHILTDATSGDASSKVPLAGKMLQCLEGVFRNGQAGRRCSKQLLQVMREAAVDLRQDPQLEAVCDEELRKFCTAVANKDGGGAECLRRQLVAGVARMRQQCREYVARLVEDVDLDVHTDPQLSAACSLDLVQHCQHVAPGRGELFQCLKNVKSPTEACSRVLSMRLEMLAMAVKVRPVDSVGDLFSAVDSSPHRHLLAGLLFSCVMVLFCCGLCCGRASKRNRRTLKDK